MGIHTLSVSESAYAELYESAPWAIVLQSLYDLIPIALFMVGAVVLLRCLYNKMVKGNYALFAAGSIMVFAAGFLKAMQKFIIGVSGYNYNILDRQFTSTQSIGFALMFVALIGMFTSYNKKYTKVSISVLVPLAIISALAEAPALKEFTSTLPFIILMVVGAAGTLVMLMIIAIKRKDVLSAVLFGLAIVFMVGMGYLSTKASWVGNWIAISVNIVYQGLFMAACLRLQKKGFGAEDSLQKSN